MLKPPRGFNGAARFHARIACGTESWPPNGKGFNGAARFHARIGRVILNRQNRFAASTGPRAFTRGSCARRRKVCLRERASTGPRAFTRGSRHVGRIDNEALRASTGPRAFTRGSDALQSSRRAEWKASTGPRAFTRGSPKQPRSKRERRGLQRGRALSRADRRSRTRRPLRKPSFNGAARFHARIERTTQAQQQAQQASTGPRAFTRGSPQVRGAYKTPAWLASTGPRAFTRGSDGLRRAVLGVDHASTGPRAFTRGSTSSRSSSRSRTSFNGAARFHARIARVLQRDGRRLDASTGPRAFTRGSKIEAIKAVREMMLQRGRALSRADRNGRLHSPRHRRGFNGAARFHARIDFSWRDALAFVDASTGPRAFTRGSPNHGRRAVAVHLASTGPRAFTRGSEYLENILARANQLQRGRALSRADRCRSRRAHFPSRGFNGAARFHARIELTMKTITLEQLSFNGAARFHARIAGIAEVVDQPEESASTGPRAFTRGSLQA